jgi:hypothetical protein
MKIKTNQYGWNSEGKVSTWVDNEISDVRNDGELERARAIAVACSEAFGRLVEVLAEKGVLSAPEVYRVAKGYHNDSATFEG